MNTSSLAGLIAQNKIYDSHRRKIDSIMTKSSHSLSFRKNDAFSNFYSSRERANRFSQKKKMEAVQKQNDLILKKIIDVNRRTHKSHVANNLNRQLSHNNLSSLRRKLTKTNQQNLKLAAKLVGTTSKLNQTILNQTYKKHAEIKQRLKKYTFDSDTGMVMPKKIKSLVRLSRLDPIAHDHYASRLNDEES